MFVWLNVKEIQFGAISNDERLVFTSFNYETITNCWLRAEFIQTLANIHKTQTYRNLLYMVYSTHILWCWTAKSGCDFDRTDNWLYPVSHPSSKQNNNKNQPAVYLLVHFSNRKLMLFEMPLSISQWKYPMYRQLCVSISLALCVSESRYIFASFRTINQCF